MIHTVHELLDATAARLPRKTAVITDEGSISYADLADQSRRLAAWLRQHSLARGERLLVVLPNGIPAVTALMAASRLGAIFCLVNPGIKPYHLAHILEDAAPLAIITTRDREDLAGLAGANRALLFDDEWEEALRSEPLDLPFPGISSDPVCLIYTSGSTGMPKAIISSHRNVVFAAWAIQQCLAIQETDVVGDFLPLSFDYGLYQVFLCFQAGATLALGRDIHVGPLLLRKLREWDITGLPLVPSIAHTLIRLCKRDPAGNLRLRFMTNTGAHLPRTYIQDLRALFPDSQIFVMFGLTECKRVSILPPPDYVCKPDSVGRPLPQTECAIVGPDGQLLPPGEVGELVVRGPHVMLGYWRAPDLTARRYRPWGPGLERALFTGDQCSLDEDGYLYFHGRADDIYKQGGYRISALELETAACDIPEVRQASLVLTEDAGSTLFVVGRMTAECIFDALRQRLEDYKLPNRIFILDDNLPLTTNGKVDKHALGALLTRML